MNTKLTHCDGETRLLWLFPGIYMTATQPAGDRFRNGRALASISGDVEVHSYPLTDGESTYSIDIKESEWNQRFSLTVDHATFVALREAINELG